MDFGKLTVGDVELEGQVDSERRRRIAANHTGTHIRHAVLRETLGTHVKQAGSLVAPDRLRFDYTHFAPLTDREIQEIEQKINDVVFKNLPVQTRVMDINSAIAGGALAFFGEKYQQEVRVVSIPDVSMELCAELHQNDRRCRTVQNCFGFEHRFRCSSDRSIDRLWYLRSAGRR